MNDAAQTLEPRLAAPRNTLDVAAVRKDFPILSRTVYDKPLVFLDNGASAQKPQAVIDAMVEIMERDYANIHRGVHYLSQRATQLYEDVRKKVAGFLNAPSENQIIFTGNATEAINLVAQSWGRANLKEGDEIVVSVMEHHANIVPWQLLEAEKGVKIRVAPIDDAGNFLLDEYEKLLGPKTRLVAVTQASNVLGTITPLAEIIRLAHDKGILVCVDGAQGAVHLDVDLQALDPDFYTFTGHKLYGPTGIGVLYGRAELLEKMPPWKGGGDMIASVSFEGTTFQGPPQRFEAGTPPIVEVIGLGAAIDYVQALGLDAIAAHEHDLLVYATERLSEVPGLRIFGTAEEKCSIISFDMDCAHPHDIGTVVDHAGVAVRTGHHCAQPLMERLGVAATTRASFALYNTREEVDALIASLDTVREMFA